MGGGLSTVFPCFAPPHRTDEHGNHLNQDLIFTASEPLDETLGHSFVYVRSSARFLSPTHSDRFISPSQSLRFSPPHELSGGPSRGRAGAPETGFRTISGASVSANTSTPRTVLQLDNIYDDATDVVAGGVAGGGMRGSIVNGFESTASFSALPLQPVPRGFPAGGGEPSGPFERSGFFLSGPIERGALSGPLDLSAAAVAGGQGGGGEGSGRVHFSAPLGGPYIKKRRRKGIPGNWKAFYRNFSEKKRPWVVPVRNFAGRKEGSCLGEDPDAKNTTTTTTTTEGSDVQWALGKAGEDRVHVVVSEEQGWLFVGIYDGFNGPDAPEFLMGNLYRAVHNELHGLFWELDEAAGEVLNAEENNTAEAEVIEEADRPEEIAIVPVEKRVTFRPEEGEEAAAVAQPRRRRLRDFLMEEEANDGLDLSGSQRFSFSVVDESNGGSAASRRWLLLSKLKQVHGRKLFPWRRSTEKVDAEEAKAENREEVAEEEEDERANNGGGRRRKEGPVDHGLVLGALSRALETTELAYLDMTDKVLGTNPELALMGSCLLVVLMRDDDVYVMNVGDSRAIVAQRLHEGVGPSARSSVEGIVEESLLVSGERAVVKVDKSETPVQAMRLTALQLSTDHGTNIEEEIIRIKNEHPDDKHCIVNDRVKGRLKVTRAFGAGFLKQPKWNDALLEMFRNEYIGTAPYISCLPSLHHHRLCTTDQFLVLSSDGLYQYLSNEEVVTHVENFMEKFPDGDPAQHLIEELLFRAAKKAGMDFHDLLDIPQGDRRKYHDDVTVMIISLEGRIWKSSGKYP